MGQRYRISQAVPCEFFPNQSGQNHTAGLAS